MHAVAFHEHGEIDNLELMDVPRPTPESDEVIVAVEAAALNHQDLFAVRELDHYVPQYPFWGGGDIAGVVDELGDEVTGWEEGDRVAVNPAISCGECEFCVRGEHSQCANYAVFGEHRLGGFAEYVAVPAENLVRVPDGYEMTKAAAAPMAAGTAWRMLVTRADVDPWDDVLIVGASGGVGSYAVQIAKNVLNVGTLYGTTSSAAKADFLRELGVDEVIDYTEEDFSRVVWEATDKRGVDVVVNNVGGETWVPSLRTLRNGGTLVTSGATAGPNPETEIRLLFVRQLNVLGSTTHTRDSFATMMEYVFDGTIDPVVQETYPLEEFEEAFRKMADRELYGKVVLTVGE
ncbi:alcohol dehydrogenase catalytic domain-containing protein [Halogeometricum luteum]|uniref:Alcohol dehydrogenase catalytic domain-containing protein n=1 Tax=Halogeometricum luteum TaxID=2950537 RepID=A0ABU2G434_9EURY|nr:alcohol dehydrogenase catalytic domain-containing protein [Halogeometricum sp. S3BR5-2]MDS0294908.1 alcohol dehydrogenase catalytic domain-containing protein [Halogeometricum sp. S3BR5-2]